MVLDNPRKFALYRQTHRDGQGEENTPERTLTYFNSTTYCSFIFSFADLFQKLPLFERPLLLRLIAGPDPEQLSFVLKENETGEVEVKTDMFCSHR